MSRQPNSRPRHRRGRSIQPALAAVAAAAVVLGLTVTASAKLPVGSQFRVSQMLPDASRPSSRARTSGTGRSPPTRSPRRPSRRAGAHARRHATGLAGPPRSGWARRRRDRHGTNPAGGPRPGWPRPPRPVRGASTAPARATAGRAPCSAGDHSGRLDLDEEPRKRELGDAGERARETAAALGQVPGHGVPGVEIAPTSVVWQTSRTTSPRSAPAFQSDGLEVVERARGRHKLAQVVHGPLEGRPPEDPLADPVRSGCEKLLAGREVSAGGPERDAGAPRDLGREISRESSVRRSGGSARG